MQESRADFIKKFHEDGVYTEDEISSAPFDTFSTKDAVVWIDPLDGTSDYCRGNVGAVTVLIGLTIKDKSRAGVVHMPFSALPDKSQGRTLFASIWADVPSWTCQSQLVLLARMIPSRG